jgi:hypothetical protein
MTDSWFNSELFQRFPQLKAASEEEFAYCSNEEPGPYIVFGILLRPEIDRVAGSDADYFKRLMDFVEETASVDIDGFLLVSIELGEPIGTLKHEDLIRRTAGPNTLKAIVQADDRARMGRLHLDRSPIASLVRRIGPAIGGVIVWAIAGGNKRKQWTGVIVSAIAGKRGKNAD